MKKILLGLGLAVFMMVTFLINAGAEEAKPEAKAEEKPAEAPAPEPGLLMSRFGQGGTGQTFGQGRDQHLRLCRRRLHV